MELALVECVWIWCQIVIANDQRLATDILFLLHFLGYLLQYLGKLRLMLKVNMKWFLTKLQFLIEFQFKTVKLTV